MVFGGNTYSMPWKHINKCMRIYFQSSHFEALKPEKIIEFKRKLLQVFLGCFTDINFSSCKIFTKYCVTLGGESCDLAM